jgi:hypothetical protein
VAISNSCQISADASTFAFEWKDYRIKEDNKLFVMHQPAGESIRRFLVYLLPDRFHRIRHYGKLASALRKAKAVKARTLLRAQTAKQDD